MKIIRTAVMSDLDAVASVEAECFPPAEAATKEEFAERLRYYGDYFWLMFEDDKLIAFVDGFVTDEKDLTDEMYEKASMPVSYTHLDVYKRQALDSGSTIFTKIVRSLAPSSLADSNNSSGISEKKVLIMIMYQTLMAPGRMIAQMLFIRPADCTTI